MAIQVLEEKLTGQGDSMSLPVYVYDDAGGAVSESDAVAAARARADTLYPSGVFGFPRDGNPGVDQLVENRWRVTIKYTRGDYKTWAATNRPWFNGLCQPWSGNFALQADRFPSTATDLEGVVRPGDRIGGSQPAFSPVVGDSYQVSIALADLASFRLAAQLARVGAIHNAAYGGYALGELALCQFSVRQVDAYDLDVQVGWSYLPNVSGENRGGVTGVSYYGHDYVWEQPADLTDRINNNLGQTVRSVYVSRPRPFADVITPTGTTPP